MLLFHEETDDRFEVKPSTILGAGSGLFAKVSLAVGERLMIHGVSLERDSPADLCTEYANAYKLRCGNRLIIPMGFAGLINHAAAPHTNLRKVEPPDGEAYFECTRHIQPGEELFFSYHTFALATFETKANVAT
jgi:hypothetical protein